MAEEVGTTDPVELVRQTNDAYNRRDLEALSSFLSPDVVYRPMPSFTDSRERRGRDDVVRFYEEFFEAWADDFVSTLDTGRVLEVNLWAESRMSTGFSAPPYRHYRTLKIVANCGK